MDESPAPADAAAHPFEQRPHRTLVTLSIPVLISLVAEPITGLVDTAFVKVLGAGPLAALGVGTVVLSSALWVFNFLGVGTQTEVAHAHGAGDSARAREVTGLALMLAAGIGVTMGVLGWSAVAPIARFMGAAGAVETDAVAYLQIRLLGGPPMLAIMAAFGALRGLHDMRTPLRIALGLNALNVALDAVLITGAGPIPAFGVAGAAWATVVAQWMGALWALVAVRDRIGLPARIDLSGAGALLVVGRDLFLRTGLLITFIMLTTRTATRIGNDAGAAHQAIRQVWLFTALALDAFAATAQSLVGYFLGAARLDLARRASGIACRWGLATGIALALGMWAAEPLVAAAFVPASALAVFHPSWLASAAVQPVNALSFVTDGIHWGTRDYRYLRNAMLGATGLGCTLLLAFDRTGEATLFQVWLVTGGWIGVRGAFGLLRVWPGIGAAPLAGRR